MKHMSVLFAIGTCLSDEAHVSFVYFRYIFV